MARGHHYKPTEAHMGHHAMRAAGGSVHHGKHHVAHHGDHDEVHHHHYKKGGKVGEDTTEGMESYTAKPNHVEEEAEERKRGGKARAKGGAVKKHVEMEGHKSRRRLDRPGRKRGGGVNADSAPFTAAHTAKSAEAHSADADEFA